MGKSIGVVLMAVGIILLLWTGFSYTKKEKIVDAGPVQISANKQKNVSWPPYAGGVVLIAGVALWLGSKNKT